MSIEITGQEKYDYQDRVVLEQILRFWKKNVSCLNEQSGKEDATLQATIEDARITMEVQVKGAEDNAQALTPAKLVEYLAHFPAHKHENSLLEKLLENNDLFVVLICAQRATDECSPLVRLKNWEGERNKRSNGVDVLVKKVLSEIETYSGKGTGTPLDKMRVGAMRELGKKIRPAKLKAAFQRLIVLEQWDEDQVMSNISWKLMQDHAIAIDIVDDVVHRLVEAIKDSKGKKGDVVPKLSEILKNASSPSVRPLDYVPRGTEDKLEKILSSERVLLLSGSPRCGKSDTARWIAAQYETQGFGVRICYSVEEADRVINDYTNAQVVVVLDDPLGSGLSEAESLPRNFRLLSRLVAKIPMSRRLIVAQSQEGLLASANVSSIGEVKIAGKAWHDLAIYPDTFLNAVWSINAAKYEVSAELGKLVSESIADGTLQVGPGTLSHLAANTHGLVSNPKLEDIHSFVAQSAQDFAMSLCTNSSSKRVVRALAIGSTAKEHAAARELAFMLGAGGEPELPAFPGMMHSFGTIDVETPELPTYASDPILTQPDKDEVAKLQSHRIISNHPSLFRFSHPFYRDAARAAVSSSAPIERNEVFEFLRRGLLCYSPESSAAAARNLRWLYKDLSKSLNLGEEIVKAAEQGLSWYFPMTRDLCYEFLVNLAEFGPSHYSSKVGDWVSRMLGAGIDDLVYSKGVCFLPEGMEQSYDPFADVSAKNQSEILSLVEVLRNGGPLPSGREAIDILKYFETEPAALDVHCVSRLLSLEEGILRASAAASWLSIDRDGDDDVLVRISLDSHPKVAADTIQIILQNWEMYNDQRRIVILSTLEPWCDKPETAAAALKEMIAHFSRGEEFGEKHMIPMSLWNVFAVLFQKAARRFPVLFWLSDSRLYSVCDEALRNLPEAAASEVAFAWADMINRVIVAGKLPSDYELGVLSSVISSPVIKGDARGDLVERLLSIPGTAATMIFFAELTRYWEELTTREQSLVKSQLSTARPDLVWLQAAVLTRAEVPAELAKLIVGQQFDMHASPEKIEASLNPALLAACVRLYRGVPGQLWFLGKHHSGSKVWESTIRLIASHPEHELFSECVHELISFDEDSLLDVVKTLDGEGREVVFDLMIDIKVKTTGEWHDVVVDLLLNTAPDEQSLKRMQKKMMSVATIVLESVTDIHEWTSHDGTRELLFSKVESDLVIVSNVIKFKKLAETDRAGAERGLSKLLEYMKGNPPALFKTYDVVQRLVRKVQAPHEVWELLEELRRMLVKSHFENQRRYSEIVETKIPLQNWIGP